MNTPVTPSSVCDMQGEREQFEAWAGDQGFPLQYTVLGDEYQDLRTQGPWEAWQARAALAERTQQEAQPIPDSLRSVWMTAPKRVWLDLGEPDMREMDAYTVANFRDLGEVTWSEDNATGWGIAYVRADLARPTSDSTDAISPIQPDYFVQHLGGSYSLADPQPLSTSAPPTPSSSDALTEFHRWRLLRVVENTQGNRRLWIAGFKAGRGQA